MKILVTGALGFTGRHLIEFLSKQCGPELYLTDFISDNAKNVLNCDLTRRESVQALIDKIRPDRIYHLAGSFTNNYDIDYSVNVLSTKNILDSLLGSAISCRVLLIGSSAEYGFVDVKDNPVSESYPLRPCRIHGLTKVYQTYLMNFYHKAYQMDIVMARTFNLSGDGRRISKLMFIGKVYDQIEKIKRGDISKIVVGNLEAKRDYIDVREAVKYYQKIMERGKSGEVYNVGSGGSIRMKDLLVSLLKEEDLDMRVVEEAVSFVPDKTDVPEIFADLKKVREL
ncbi:MAG: GDP-mannose 4,6-dehydratase [Candidatus Omnitrophica bacterium]|nr:GDP-mannose 4,6-dehydratase [Candidatus Omnitrophota bacterium]